VSGLLRRWIFWTALVAGAWMILPAPGWAVSNPHPLPPRRLTVQGQLVGKLGKGAVVRFQIVATDPSGWPDLNEVKIVMLLNGQPIQEISYSVDDRTLVTTGQPPIQFPEQTTLSGSFLEVFRPRGVNIPPILHRTFTIDLAISAKVREEIPGATVVRVIATNDDGDLSYARVQASLAGGWLSWGTFGLAAGVALFFGAVIGNMLTSRRYRQRQPSIWQILERRLREQKARPPAASQPARGYEAID
jgi:hypothetical protein